MSGGLQRIEGWRLLAGLAAMAGLALLVGCGSTSVVVPAGVSATPSPAGVPAASQNNVSTWPLLDRLGRWDGTTFRAVEPGSVAGGTVLVMTHGWAPGLAPTIENLTTSSSALVTMWNPQLVDSDTGQPVAAGFEALAKALSAADPAATVLMYSWIDQSASGTDLFQAGIAERATEVNGHRMAAAIDLALAADFTDNDGQLHLLGHSFGANVATTASLATSVQPRQLTLFDSPETPGTRFGGAGNDLRYKLTRLPVGRNPGEVFVDNYISEVGQPYGNLPGLSSVLDVRLRPPASDNDAQRHQFPIGWYAQSAGAPAAQVGYWWSPLAGADTATLDASYAQADPGQPLELDATGGPPATNQRAGLAYTAAPLVLLGGGARSDVLELAGDAVTVATVEFSTDENSLWLTFDLEFVTNGAELATGANRSADDTVSIYVDGRQRWLGAGPEAGIRPAGNVVVLYDLDPGNHTIAVVLAGPTTTDQPAGGTEVRLGDFSVVSATEIVRDADPDRSKSLVFDIVRVAALLVLAIMVVLAVMVVRRVRRRRGRRRQEMSRWANQDL
jgi:hypothetical protein